MNKESRAALWLFCGGISVAVAMVMSPWSVLACFGSFAVAVAVSMHKDKVQANEAND